MSKKNPQIEEAIIKEFMLAAFKWSVLILFVLALYLVGYLIAENKQLQNEKQNFQTEFDSLAKIKLKEDSIIDAMPEYLPGGFHLDERGIINPNFTQND
jgi:cell division protein FtsB